MLLRFGVSNFRSLRDRQELSLVASSLDDDRAGLIAMRQAPGPGLLPCVVIYGANASGKSSVVDAMSWMRSAVLYSHNRGRPGGGVPRTPFALDPDAGSLGSDCDLDFIVEDVRYHYGFKASDSAFTSEWLFSFPNGRQQSLFEREAMNFKFGRGLKGRNQTIADLTRPNSLFLAAATQNSHEELSKITTFFENILIGDFGATGPVRTGEYRGLDPRIIDFLDTAGTGVVDYRLEAVSMPANPDTVQKALAEAMEKLKVLIKDAGGDAENDALESKKILQLGHRAARGNSVFFNLHQESTGTRRLLALLTAACKVLDTGGLMIVDELDASVHTQVCDQFVRLFSSPVTNPKGAQLIATTHDTNLLASPSLRRDQIWFTEKDSAGATHLYPVTDFRTRKSDNLERGYLQGRFGAIPFAGRLPELTKGH